MSALLIRLLFIFLSLLLAVQNGISVPIVISLLGVIFVSSFSYIKTNRTISFILILLYLMIGFFYIESAYFLPVLGFELSGFVIHLSSMKQYSSRNRTALYAINILSACCYFSQIYILATTQTVIAAVYISILTILSFMTRMLCDMNVDLQQKLHTIQDISKEHELSLKNKNHELLEKQDYEIYLATLQERNRIAREIHDNVGHLLTRSILQVGAMKATTSDESSQKSLEDIRLTLDTAMTCIRTSVHDLHDDSVDLKAALIDFKSSFPNLHITMEYDCDTPPAREVKYSILAIVREALSNTMKHSDATSSTIIFRRHPAFYQLLIEDNGSSSDMKESGIGLITMRERVEKLGGSFRISTEKGFRIFIMIPLNVK